MFRPSEIKTCHRCGADVRWTLTEARKKLAVNAEPDEKGNAAVMRDVGGVLRSRAVTSDRPLLGHERLMMPHAASCAPRAPRDDPPPKASQRGPQGRAGGLYRVLGVAPSATTDEIRSAYRTLARRLHPDRNPNPADADRFKGITEAYGVLSNPDARRTYDLTGRAPRPR